MREEGSLSGRQYPPDALLMSKVSRSVQPAGGNQGSPAKLSACSRPVHYQRGGTATAVRGYQAALMWNPRLTFGSHGERGISGSLGRELAPERGH